MKSYSLYIMTLLLAGTIALTGCSGVKDLAKPDIDIPAEYSPGTASNADSLTVADMEWWEFYADEPLRAIISRTLENNRDILRAASRVEELRQLYGIEKVNLTLSSQDWPEPITRPTITMATAPSVILNMTSR